MKLLLFVLSFLDGVSFTVSLFGLWHHFSNGYEITILGIIAVFVFSLWASQVAETIV